MSASEALRVGVDIGGTFTDLVALDPATGAVQSAKVPTIVDDQAQAFLDALDAANISASAVSDFVHGTTVGLNAVLERRTARVGVLCTQGFRDVLDLRRLWRERLFGNGWERPVSLVDRELRLEVRERMLPDGSIEIPLAEEDVRVACTTLTGHGVESVAICFLHSYANPEHELQAARIVSEELPNATVTVSSTVLPEIREYERSSTTVVSAQLRPVLASYVGRLGEKLAAVGSSAPLRIMGSHGAVMTARAALTNPATTLLSGPAAGVTAAASVARAIEADYAITFDMGGTSTDVGLIEMGEPLVTMERELQWDIPVRGPALDIRTIGAGGGSIAWIDDIGGLHVGPASAAADPGPACYGLGGTEATVTDANLVLGRLAPQGFLHGMMQLDEQLAAAALLRVGEPYGWSEVEAAAAVWRIAHTNMSLLIRETTINRGFDPRDFTLISFGGAGGLYAAELARDLGIPRVCVPVHASGFSALGGLLAELTYDYVQTFLAVADSSVLEPLENICETLRRRASVDLERDGAQADTVRERYFVDARYVGEGFELTVPADFADGVTPAALDAVCERFHARHAQLYTFDRPGEAIQFVNVRYRAVVVEPRPSLQRAAEDVTTRATTGQPERRQTWFDVPGTFVEAHVVDRRRLDPGSMLEGPALIQEPDTVTLIAPGQSALVDDWGNILIHTGVADPGGEGSASSPIFDG